MRGHRFLGEVRPESDDDRVWPAWRSSKADSNEADRLLIAGTRARPDDPAVWRARLAWARAGDRPDAAMAALPHIPADEATTSASASSPTAPRPSASPVLLGFDASFLDADSGGWLDLCPSRASRPGHEEAGTKA